MEDKNLSSTTNSEKSVTAPLESTSRDAPKSKKRFLLIVLVVVLLIAALIAFLLIDMKNKNSSLSSIDDSITEIENLFKSTEDVDKNLGNLSEDFLESESVSTQEIDDSISELDAEIADLENLDEDFGLEEGDVGL